MLFTPRSPASDVLSESQRRQVLEFRRLANTVAPEVEVPDEDAAELLFELGWNPEAAGLAALATRTRSLSSLIAALLPAIPSLAADMGPVERILELGRKSFAASQGAELEAWICLALFPGWFDLEQSKSVLGFDSDINPEEILGRLVARGVIISSRESEPMRFRMPALYRGPANAALTPGAQKIRRQARNGLRTWWLDRARTVDHEWFGAGQRELFRQTELYLESLEPLLTSSDPHDGGEVLDILGLLEPFWSRTNRNDVAVRLLERTLRTADASTRQRFDGLRILVWFMASYDIDAAERYFLEVLELLPEIEETAWARARVDRLTGFLALYRGDAVSAQSKFEQAITFDITEDDDGQTYIDLSFLAAAASLAGDQVVSYDYCERAIAMCDRHGETWLKTYTVWAFALSAWRTGDRHRAYVLALDGIEAADDANDQYAAAICFEVAAWYEAGEGKLELAARILGLADALRLAIGIPALFWGAKELHDEAVSLTITKLGPGPYQTAFRSVTGAGISEGLAWLRLEGGESVSKVDDRGAASELTPRQREIAFLIAEGRSNKEIARLLLITVRTVETHIEHIFARLGVASRAQIAAWNVRSRI